MFIVPPPPTPSGCVVYETTEYSKGNSFSLRAQANVTLNNFYIHDLLIMYCPPPPPFILWVRTINNLFLLTASL